MAAHGFHTRFKAVKMHLEEGLSITEVNCRLNISRVTITSWIKNYLAKGEAGLRTQYANSGKRMSDSSLDIIERAKAYKQLHPEWGAPFILVKLADDFPNRQLPKVRWLQIIFQRSGLQPRRDRLPKSSTDWVKAAFDRVQVDAKEKLKTADGQGCCYLNFTDEYTGSVLDAFLFPLRKYYRSSTTISLRRSLIGLTEMGAYKMLSIR